jgi:hypothetical protein
LSTVAAKAAGSMTGWYGPWLLKAAGNGVSTTLGPVLGEGSPAGVDGDGDAAQAPATIPRLTSPAATGRMWMVDIVALPADTSAEAPSAEKVARAGPALFDRQVVLHGVWMEEVQQALAFLANLGAILAP